MLQSGCLNPKMKDMKHMEPRNHEIDWQQPIPLITDAQSPQHAYLIEALPDIVKEAILAYQQYGQQPTPLIACSALANISLACQSLANVAYPVILCSI